MRLRTCNLAPGTQLKNSCRRNILPQALRGWWIACAVLLAGSVYACQVPVFRYALERWEADKYELLVIHEGALESSAAQLVAELRDKNSQDQDRRFTTRTIDLSTDRDAAATEIWKTHATGKGPLLAVLYPEKAQVSTRLAHCTEFTKAEVDRVLESPVRQSLVKKLLEGDSAVWVFVPCGDKQKDQAAQELMSEQLEREALWHELPSAAELEVPSEVIEKAKVKLRIGFSMVTLQRDDPAESFVLNALLNSESDLRDFEEPMAFPVFGRGRVLYALIGRGISPDTIRSASAFITGPCSCQVKGQNPGFDLLLSCDWEEAVGETLISEPIGAIPIQPQVLTIPPGRSR